MSELSEREQALAEIAALSGDWEVDDSRDDAIHARLEYGDAEIVLSYPAPQRRNDWWARLVVSAVEYETSAYEHSAKDAVSTVIRFFGAAAEEMQHEADELDNLREQLEAQALMKAKRAALAEIAALPGQWSVVEPNDGRRIEAIQGVSKSGWVVEVAWTPRQPPLQSWSAALGTTRRWLSTASSAAGAIAEMHRKVREHVGDLAAACDGVGALLGDSSPGGE